MQEEDVVDKRGDLLNVARNRIDPILEQVAGYHASLQHLKKTGCDHKRCAQFMGNIAEEFTARHFLLCKLLVGSRQFSSAKTEVFDSHFIIGAQAVADLTDHRHCNAGAVMENAVKTRLIKLERGQLGFCRDGCSARSIMNERHLAEEIPRAKRLEQTGFTIIDVLRDLHLAFEDHVKAVFNGIFAAKDCASSVRAYLTVGDQLFDLREFDAWKGTRNDLGWGSLGGHICSIFWVPLQF